MKKNIIFIFVLSIIIGVLSIIYYSGDNVKDNPLKNNLIKTGYNEEEADKILNVFSEDIDCIQNNYLTNISALLDNKDFNAENKCNYIKYITKNNVKYDIAIEMVNDNLENYDFSEVLYNIKNDPYFIVKNTDRYINYSNKNSNLDTRKVVSSVNANIDFDYYTNIQKVNSQSDLLVIVNKYYALDENYVPDTLVSIASPYGWGKVDKRLYENFKLMADDARKLNLNLYIASGYRDYNYQKALYNGYLKNDPVSIVDTYSARPGHSEHQTGLAIDLSPIDDSFAYTNEYKWLKDNAHKYGFILRYPNDLTNLTGYKYEPWHYRYVGKDVATYIYTSGITFDEYYEYFINHSN